MLYLWVKALHIIFVVAWMATLLIYPRYKIHQMSSAAGEPLFDTMSEAAVRLRRIIMTPSLILVWVFGLSMIALNPALMSEGWLHAKLALVLVMSGFHGWLVGVGRSIDQGEPKISARTMRMVNELPFIIFIVITILVVVRPF